MAPSLTSDFARLVAAEPSFPLFERGPHLVTRADVERHCEILSEEAPSLAPGSRIGLRCEAGPLFLAALLAFRQRGWATVLFEARTPDVEVDRQARRLGVHATLAISDAWPNSSRTSADVADRTQWMSHAHTPLDRALNSADDPTGAAIDRGAWNRDPEIAVIKLTSGSEGEPRGVLVTEAGLLADESGLTESMGLRSERILTTIPLSHSYGLSSIAITALRRDATIVVPESSNPLSTLRCLRHSGITFFPSVPAWLNALVELAGNDGGDVLGNDLRLVISAGAPLSPLTAKKFLEVFGQHIHTFYGATECGGITFDRTGEAGLRGALGTPIDGVEITLIDEATLEPLTVEPLTVEPLPGQGAPSGSKLTAGLVSVRSEAVAKGYLGGPEANDSLSEGRFITSDLATLGPLGLSLTGRRTDVVNIKGLKVHPAEVEAVLARRAGVREVFVCGDGGQSSPTVLRALVAVEPGGPDRSQILVWCRQHLSDYKVPRSIQIIEKLPRTERGKIDREGVRRLIEAGGRANDSETLGETEDETDRQVDPDARTRSVVSPP